MESGVIIRPAVPADAICLLELGYAQSKESAWHNRDAFVFDPPSFIDYLEQLSKTGVILVAEKDGHIGGAYGANITTLTCNRHILLSQGVFWYCEPEFRKEAGLPLLAAGEKAAKSRGVRWAVVSTDDGEHSAVLNRLYRMQGYKPAEQLHLKRL